MSKRRSSIATKLYIFIIVTILAAATGTALLAYSISVNQINNYYKSVTYDTAVNFSTLVDGDFLLKLRKCAESEEYQKLRDEAEKNEDEAVIQAYLEEKGLWEEYVKTRNRLVKYLRNMESIKYLYIIVWGGADEKYDMYLIDDDDNPIYETGYYEAREPEFYGIDATKKIEPTISTGDWGWLCSAFAPVYDSKGNVVCQVGCDFGMDEVMAERNRSLMYILATAIGVTILILLIAMVIIRKLVINPINSMTQEMKKFTPSNTDYKTAGVMNLALKGNDELTDLYNGIRSMQVNIIDYLNDLDELQKGKEKAEEDIKDLSKEAYRDALTGVGTKTAYIKKTAELNQHMSGADTEFAIVMVDLNDLKKVNDKYGHKMGDLYIKGSCQIVCDTFKHSPVYRIGGDEFVVILQNQDYTNRHAATASLKEQFIKAGSNQDANPWERYSAAVGMAESASDDKTLDLVFRRADKAMYEEKRRWKEAHGSYR